MYIKKLIYKNVGPIEYVSITPSFTSEGNPKPILLVGENGTGKSTIISNIVDALYVMGSKAYDNVYKFSESNTQQYYKAILHSDIHSGESAMFSCIQFDDDNQNFIYLFKSGNLTKEEIQLQVENISLDGLNGKLGENYKEFSINRTKSEDIFNKNVICYFGPDRYEKPIWLGSKYYETIENTYLGIHTRWGGNLANEISVKNVTTVNLRWLMDVIADSRADIVKNNSALEIKHVVPEELLLLGQARKNLEDIMSDILGVRIYFKLNFRNSGGSRFSILRESDDSVVAPSLDALSTGQIALFNTFTTIIRYADKNDINNSIKLQSIKGIVVIDEIELHLHTTLQKEVLPKLIQRFPKVQFIITTHAPLFLLGMRETFSDDGFEIYDLPYATKISSERFSEFKKAFEYLKDTHLYQKEISTALEEASNEQKVLVVTEGSTDWKHMKAAYNSLKLDPKHAELFADLDFNFLEYETKKSKRSAAYNLEMGGSQLLTLCQNCAKIPRSNKLIFIADRDDNNVNKKLAPDEGEFKEWGNNVFSFILPLPKTREKTPAICIEHLYSDQEIKTEYENENENDKIARRLYMGNEFDKRGIAIEIDRVCSKKNVCGPESIAIIDGSSEERVTRLHHNDETNYALSKLRDCK